MPPFLSYTASHHPGDATTSLPNVRNSWALVNTAPRSPLRHNVSYEQGHTHPNVSQLLFWPRPHAGSPLLASRQCGLSSLEFLGVPTPACALCLAAGPHALFLRAVREGPWRVCSPTWSTCAAFRAPGGLSFLRALRGVGNPPPPLPVLLPKDRHATLSPGPARPSAGRGAPTCTPSAETHCARISMSVTALHSGDAASLRKFTCRGFVSFPECFFFGGG